MLADAGKQLNQKIVHFQEVGFQLTRNHVSRSAVKIRKEHSLHETMSADLPLKYAKNTAYTQPR
jgi:hypothetical protein